MFSDRIEYRYPKREYTPGYNIYIIYYINYMMKSDGRIGSSYYNPSKYQILKEAYKQPVYSILKNNKLTFHALKKSFIFFRNFTLFKKYQKIIELFNFPKGVTNKIAWYCVD